MSRFLALLICLTSSAAFGQNKVLIDSLNKLLPRQTDSMRVWTLTSIAWEYRPYNQERAIEFNQQALDIAQRMRNPEQSGYCWMAIGNVYNYYRKSSEALAAYQNALSFFEKVESKQGKIRYAQLYYNLGLLWNEGFGNNKKAITALLNALKINDEINNLSGASKCCATIASIFQSQDNKVATIYYYKQAWKYATHGQDFENQANVLNGLSTSYLKWYRQSNNPAFLDSAVAGLQKGTNLIVLHRDKIQPQYLPTLLANLGECYYWKEDYEKAVKILKESTELSKPISYTSILPNNYSLLALLASRQGNIKEANAYLKLAIQVTNIETDLESKAIAIQNMYSAYKYQKNWQQASHWQQQLQAVKDSLNNHLKNKTITQLLLQYETKKKNENIKMLEEKVKTNQNILLLFAVVSLLILAVAATLYQGQKLRHKLLQEKQARLQQKHIHLQENLDFKQRELIVQTVNIEHKKELLLTIKRFLEEGIQKLPAAEAVLQPTFKLINSNLTAEKDFEQFCEHFQQVHPDFFQTLSKQSINVLTTTDLRYCAYLRMRLASKEIATLLNIEPASIRVAKHRLKAKLGLSSEENLEEFIQRI